MRRGLEVRAMGGFARSIPGRAVAPAALTLLAALTCFPSPSHALRICDDCAASADTAGSPGKTSTSHWLVSLAIAPPVGFVGADSLLRCAIPVPGGWQIEIVDPVSAAGGSSMELDSALEPMISYHDAQGMLYWAQRLGTGWVREPVDPVGRVLGATSIARGPAGVGIAYVDVTTGLLKYAQRNAGGAWSIEAVADAGASEAYPSLIVDGPLRAISYYDASRGDLRLALGQGGSWSSSLIDSAGDVGGYTSLVGRPSSGVLGVAYYDFTNADLRYAHGAPGAWMIETVDGAADSVGRFCSAVAFAANPEDQVGIGYYDGTHGDLKYALKRGPVWATTVLDTTGDTGGSVSCGGTPAPDDTIGIVYVDRGAGDLHYQWRANALAAVPVPGPTPTALRVEWHGGTDGAGGRIRFTVPVSGNVRVSLYDPQGRLMAVPLQEELLAGSIEARWDGRDERGDRVRAGVFFVRVETMGGAGTATAVVLR